MSTPLQIASFYHFQELSADEIRHIDEISSARAAKLGVLGLIILGAEGLNATLSGPTPALAAILSSLSEALGGAQLQPKFSEAPRHPFFKFQVKLRPEIVTIGDPEVKPSTETPRLTPAEWQACLETEDVVLLDTRNWYETRIGKFRSAIAPETEEFREFPEYLRRAEIPKDKKVLIYCTGGIRCEKAIVEMSRQGFENVFQLDGGILGYLERFPNQAFEGECFVFDHRVAVDQNLRPTRRYSLCPHCGQPADVEIACGRCDRSARICVSCTEKAAGRVTCSKNCAHHYARTNAKGRPQIAKRVPFFK